MAGFGFGNGFWKEDPCGDPVDTTVEGQLDFSDADLSALLVLLEDI